MILAVSSDPGLARNRPTKSNASGTRTSDTRSPEVCARRTIILSYLYRVRRAIVIGVKLAGKCLTLRSQRPIVCFYLNRGCYLHEPAYSLQFSLNEFG